MSSQKDTIFKNVEVLIYVFDVESEQLEVIRVSSISQKPITSDLGRYE